MDEVVPLNALVLALGVPELRAVRSVEALSYGRILCGEVCQGQRVKACPRGNISIEGGQRMLIMGRASAIICAINNIKFSLEEPCLGLR